MRSRDRRIVIALAALCLVACVSDPLPGYRVATSDERFAVVPEIERYFAMRERVAVSGDVAELHDAYPALSRGADRREGINNEGAFAELARLAREQAPAGAPSRIARMWHELEHYDAIRVYVKGGTAVAFVHGLEHFEYASSPVPSAGEILMRFDLRREGRWLIERTDELLMGERPPATPAY